MLGSVAARAVSTCHITAATGSELKKLKKGMQMNNNKARYPVTDYDDVHANNGAAQQKIELLFSRYSALGMHTDRPRLQDSRHGTTTPFPQNRNEVLDAVDAK
jgi:hypothetical protein